MKTWMVLVGVCLVGAAPMLSAAPIVRHEGATDPVTEGFYVAGVDVHLIETGPVYGDQGYDAWKYDDPQGPEMQYRYDFSSSDRAQIADGWTVTVRARVVDNDVWVGAGLSAIDMFDRANAGRRYQIRLGSDGEGNQILAYYDFVTGGQATPLITLDGGSVYHLYEMSWDGNDDGLVSIYADSAEILSGYQGGSDGRNQFKVGCGQENGQGLVHYNLFEVIPAPGPECEPGDADGDGDVDDDDLSLLLANWGSETAGCTKGEFSGVPPVDDDDLSLLLANWTGPLASAVPEPTSAALVLLGAAALRRPQRIRRDPAERNAT